MGMETENDNDGNQIASLATLAPPAFPMTQDDVLTVADGETFQVVDGHAYARGFDLLDGFSELEKAIVKYHSNIKGLANQLVNAVRQRESADLRPVQFARKRLSMRLAEWKEQQDRQDREQQREAQRIADEAAQQEQQRKADIFLRLAEQEPEMREALIIEAETVASVPVTAPTVALTSSVPVVAGGFTRKTWRAEVFDLKALLRAWLDGKCVLNDELIIDGGLQGFLNTQARALRERVTEAYPGVRAVHDSTAVTRRG